MKMEEFEKSGPKSEEEILLFSSFRSSCSWRIRTILNLKKIKYKKITLALLKDEQKSEFYKKYNPASVVPCLYIEKQSLGESMAIAEFLEEKFPNSFPLLSKDLYKRAKIRQICEIINSGIQPLQNLFQKLCVKKDIEKMGGGEIDWLKKWNLRGLAIIEKVLEESRGKYSVGDELTLADCFLLPQFKGAVDRFGINPEDFPNINSVFENLKIIDEFIDAFPQNQPDAF